MLAKYKNIQFYDGTHQKNSKEALILAYSKEKNKEVVFLSINRKTGKAVINTNPYNNMRDVLFVIEKIKSNLGWGSIKLN